MSSYTLPWSEAFPPDTQLARLLGQDIRDFKTEIRERVGTHLSGTEADIPVGLEAIWAGLMYWAIDTGQVFRWNGATWDNITADFIAPVQITVVAYSATPIFDGAVGNVFEITLTGNVSSSTFVNPKAGQRYYFIIHEDATGGRTFAWPVNVPGLVIDLEASATTVESFIVDTALDVERMTPERNPAVSGVGGATLGSDTALANDTTVDLITSIVTMPAVGGPWRVLIDYSIYLENSRATSCSSTTAWVSDGSVKLATAQSVLPEGTVVERQGGVNGHQTSPSYADSTVVTFVLRARQKSHENTNVVTALKLPFVGSDQASYLGLAVVTSA